ncbi:hypothetical protein BXZ70DRAFT_1007074 [Cristinia sonorae]|uniref:Uncharacterized protein n=1 Tax=Cristinia sonorae TaxID=1940300 RepID=A0A8K0XQY6_9AGAR|nr:hypothetical protein BXZ70DRAFT_1007074 [Cristinia sonorae]
MSNTEQADLRPFDYELPPAPQKIVDTWVTRLQAVAIVTALLAQIEAGLVGDMEPLDPQTATDVAARFFGYGGLILNLGATLSAVLLLLAVTSVNTQSRRLYMTCSHGYPRKVFQYNDSLKQSQTVDSTPSASKGNFGHNYEYLNPSSSEQNTLQAAIRSFNQTLFRGNTEETILDAFGVASGWGLMLRHCIFCFLGGSIATFVHVTILLWMNESTVVAATLMPVVFVGFVPPVMVYAFRMESKVCPQCKLERANPAISDIQIPDKTKF